MGPKRNFTSANSVDEAVRDAQKSGSEMCFCCDNQKYIDELWYNTDEFAIFNNELDSIRDEIFNNHNDMEALFAAFDSHLVFHWNRVFSVYRLGERSARHL